MGGGSEVGGHMVTPDMDELPHDRGELRQLVTYVHAHAVCIPKWFVSTERGVLF